MFYMSNDKLTAMKKTLTALLVCFAFTATAFAQEKAIGLRFGGGTAFNGEISYQQSLSDANRLELDLGLYGSGVSLSGVYQWVWGLPELADGFSWYAGVGGGILSYDGFNLGLLGQIGIEYKLPSVPLQFSLDVRPGFYLMNGYGNGSGAALGVRYTF
jgi:hypothetical protein